MGDYDFFHTTKTVKVSGFRSISVEIVFAFCREATHRDFPKGFERTGYCGRHQVPNQFETAMLCPRRLRGALIGRYRGHSNTNVSGYLRHPFRETARRVCHFCPFLPSLALFGVKARTGFVCCLSCCLAALEHYSTPVCDVVREVLRKKSQFL